MNNLKYFGYQKLNFLYHFLLVSILQKTVGRINHNKVEVGIYCLKPPFIDYN